MALPRLGQRSGHIFLLVSFLLVLQSDSEATVDALARKVQRLNGGKHSNLWRCPSKTVRVGGTFGWIPGVKNIWQQPEIYAGDELVFAYSSILAGPIGHSVHMFPDKEHFNECDFVGAKYLGKNDVTFKVKHAGVYFFGCASYGHCSMDQKLRIVVTPAKECDPIGNKQPTKKTSSAAALPSTQASSHTTTSTQHSRAPGKTRQGSSAKVSTGRAQPKRKVKQAAKQVEKTGKANRGVMKKIPSAKQGVRRSG